MKSASTPNPPRRSLWTWIAISIFGGMGLGLLLLGVGVYNLLTLSREAAILRREVLAGGGFEGTRKIQGTAGPLLLGSAGLVLPFIDHVPAEAREAVAALKSASVGVYELHAAPTTEERSRGFAAADAAMERSGWMRAVRVNDHAQSFALYFPVAETAGTELCFCVAVLDHRRLVVISARANAGELGQLAQRRFPKLI